MKKAGLKFLMITAIGICTSFSANCQTAITTTEPSTQVPNKWLRNAAKLIEIGKIDQERIKLYAEQITLLNRQIAIKDSIIKTHVAKDTTERRIFETYKQEVANLIEQRDIAAKAMVTQNKKFRRQKRKTVFVAIAGPVITATVFVYLKK